MTVAAQYWQLIDFSQIEIVATKSYPPRSILVVNGMAPFPGAEVSLVPLVYLGRPPYWGIQVACRPGDDAEAAKDAETAAYSARIDLVGITGTHGVEVIGATRTAHLVVTAEDA